jgi:hypothetical protein
MNTIASLATHWETYGARWVFFVTDATTGEEAAAYVSRYGIDFGWSTSDRDNTEGAQIIVNSSLYAAQPWTGVIDAETMVLVYDEPDTSYLDIEAIAVELAK